MSKLCTWMDEIPKLDLCEKRWKKELKKEEIPKSFSLWKQFNLGSRKAWYGKRKQIVFNAEAFDKAFLHHLFIKIRCIKMWAKGYGKEGVRKWQRRKRMLSFCNEKKWEQMLYEFGFSLNLPWINTAGTSRAQQQHEFQQNSAKLCLY